MSESMDNDWTSLPMMLKVDFTALGGIAMDPSRKAFVLLDRVRGRVYSAAWPLEAEGGVLRGDGEDRGVHDFRAVSGMAAQEGGAVGERGEPREL